MALIENPDFECPLCESKELHTSPLSGGWVECNDCGKKFKP